MPGDGVRSVKAANEAAIFARANVVGVAVGNKVIGGRETGEACIVVFVEAKRPEPQLRHRDGVPKALGGVRTDLVETGRFHAFRAAQTTNMGRTKRGRAATGQVNLVDAAVAEPIDAGSVSRDILGIGRVTRTRDAELGIRVRKSGRTSGITEGRVTALDATVEVDYGGQTAVFREQVVSDLVSKGGDSGSLVVDESGRAVGLLFAGGATTTLINPIAAIAHFLEVTFG